MQESCLANQILDWALPLCCAVILIILYQYYFIAQIMRPIETPFQAQLPTSLGVPNYISSGSSWLPHHILFFSLCLKGRYADFELCFIAQNQMQYRNIQYCCYPDFCPLFLHIFLSQICIFISFSVCVLLEFLYANTSTWGSVSLPFFQHGRQDTEHFFSQLTIYRPDPFMSQHGDLLMCFIAAQCCILWMYQYCLMT